MVRADTYLQGKAEAWAGGGAGRDLGKRGVCVQGGVRGVGGRGAAEPEGKKSSSLALDHACKNMVVILSNLNNNCLNLSKPQFPYLLSGDSHNKCSFYSIVGMSP